MSLSFTLKESKYESVATGNYVCLFREVKPCEAKLEYGDALQWRFEIVEGADKGKHITGLSGTKPNFGGKKPTKLSQWLSYLANKQLTDGVTITPSDYYGQKFMVIVENTDGRATIKFFSKI